LIDISDDDSENYNANDKEQTSSRKGRYEEILQNFINLKRFRKIFDTDRRF